MFGLNTSSLARFSQIRVRCFLWREQTQMQIHVVRNLWECWRMLEHWYIARCKFCSRQDKQSGKERKWPTVRRLCSAAYVQVSVALRCEAGSQLATWFSSGVGKLWKDTWDTWQAKLLWASVRHMSALSILCQPTVPWPQGLIIAVNVLAHQDLCLFCSGRWLLFLKGEACA